MISYYELLGMIKEGKAPNKIKAHLNSQPQVYVREDDLDDTFNYYGLEEEEKEDSDYHYYLAEDFLESSMFEQNIEILDEKEIPEKIECYHQYDECVVKDKFYQDQKGSLVDEIIIDKINEIIDILNRKGE